MINDIKACSSKNLKDVNVFDIYAGSNLDSDKKSIAFSLEFENFDKTLTESEVMEDFNKIIEFICKKYNAILRDK